MTATQKFYTGFFIAVALVIAVSYFVGYHAGETHVRHEVRSQRSAS